MKAAFVTTNLQGGGAEKAVLALARGLARRGHEAHVILLEDVTEHPAEQEARVHALTKPGVRCGKGWFGKRASALALRRLMRRLERGRRFDLVVSTLPYCDEVVALSGIEPVWFRVANTLSVEIELLGRNSRGKAERRHARYRRLYGASNVIAVSDGVARDLTQTLGLTGANVVRIYNPIDREALRSFAARPEARLPKEPYLIHAGRFAPQKRHDLLLEALRRSGLSHRLVLLVHPSAALERLIAASGVSERVTIAGFQPNPYPWIAGAELLVLCSDHEGMPNVLAEALACGTRVVSTDCPSGPRELLRDSLARFLVPCGDTHALAAAMRDALAAPRPLPPAVLDEFQPERVFAQYEALPQMTRGV